MNEIDESLNKIKPDKVPTAYIGLLWYTVAIINIGP